MKELTLDELAQRAGISAQHLCYGLRGRAISARALRSVRESLGENGWAFAIGETNILTDENLSA